MSFCRVDSLKRLEVTCKGTNNSKEVRDTVEAIAQGLNGTKSPEEISDIRAALIHLCYMTENLKHQADVRCVLLCVLIVHFAGTSRITHVHISLRLHLRNLHEEFCIQGGALGLVLFVPL